MKKMLLAVVILTSISSFARAAVVYSGVDERGEDCSIKIEGNGQTLIVKTSYSKNTGELSLSEKGSGYLQEFNIPANTPVFYGILGEHDEYQGVQVHLIPIIENDSLSGFSKFTYRDNTGLWKGLNPFERVCSDLK